MSADNAIFVVKTKAPDGIIYGVFHGSASWFEELWLDTDSIRDSDTGTLRDFDQWRYFDAPEPGKLQELFDGGEVFTCKREALVHAGKLASEALASDYVPYIEYGVQIVDFSGEHEPWTKDHADRVLREASQLEELCKAVAAAVEAEGPGSSFTFQSPGLGDSDSSLLVCYPIVSNELLELGFRCQWVIGDAEQPECYKITPDSESVLERAGVCLERMLPQLGLDDDPLFNPYRLGYALTSIGRPETSDAERTVLGETLSASLDALRPEVEASGDDELVRHLTEYEKLVRNLIGGE